MENLFDNIQVAAQGIVSNTMGYTATWTPSTGGSTQTARVLFNKPTQKAEVTDEEYAYITTKMEYLEGSFPGLADAVMSNKNETITISGIDYQAYKVDKKFDGKTIIIQIAPAE